MDTPPSADPPDSSLLRKAAERLKNIFRRSRPPDTTEDLEHEIQELLEEGEEHGLITSQEGMMINSIFEFRDTLTREIMTPRSEMVSAPVSASVSEVIRLVTDKGFTRIPIHGETQDNIIGILNAKDLLACVENTGKCPGLAELVKPAYLVPETKPIVDLLRDFQARKIHMAVVTDEFGGVRGLVTLEDVLEEIVGEIDDEYDKGDRGWRVLADGSLLIYAKIDIEEVESFFNITLPEGPYESVGGLIIHQLGHVPRSGEAIEVDGLLFKVVAATRRHIKTVRILRRG